MASTSGVVPDFVPAHAGLRIRRLQALCSQHSLDGLLFVCGLDGKFSAGCQQAVGYLFEGHSGRDTLDVTKLSRGLEDVIVLVRADALRVYAPSGDAAAQLQDLLLPYARGMAVFSPSPEEAADPDALEEHKVASLVQIVRGCRRLGIPCGLASGSATAAGPLPQGALMELERWPVLQAYGLDGVGRGGFFTMNFEVRWSLDVRWMPAPFGLIGLAFASCHVVPRSNCTVARAASPLTAWREKRMQCHSTCMCASEQSHARASGTSPRRRNQLAAAC